jgi:D-amino peptidase
MKVYIAFDLEGCTCTSIRAQMGPNPAVPSAYPRAQRMATDDVLAAIEGILEVDPETEIVFNDGHGKNMNVFFEEFPENVSIVMNSREEYDEVLGIDDSFDALICIGAHGNVLTADALMCHVWNARSVEFNGKSLTETGLDASLAGYYGIPLVAMSGDEASMKYIKNNISKKIAAAVVKKGIGQFSAICLNPKRTRKRIKAAVIDGLKRRHEIPPLTFDNPVSVEISYPMQFNAHATSHFMNDERLSATEVKYVAENAKEAYYGFLTRRKLSAPRPI